MAAAFNEQEREAIVRRLRDAARRCAATIGVRKTTLEQLAREAGISKSAFYRFYDSKERLFLDILEEWHTAIYGSAAAVLEAWPQAPMALLCALCSFGGLSIWLQNLLFVPACVRPAKLLCVRMLHGALSGGLALLIFTLFPGLTRPF